MGRKRMFAKTGFDPVRTFGLSPRMCILGEITVELGFLFLPDTTKSSWVSNLRHHP